MQIQKSAPAAAILAFLAFAACTTVDEERQQMRGTIESASNLASEIKTWRASFPGDVPATVVDSITGFQNRAQALLSNVNGLSPEATAGKDLTAMRQALQTLVDFDTGAIESSSPTARASLLDQFQGLADNLQSAVARIRQY